MQTIRRRDAAATDRPNAPVFTGRSDSSPGNHHDVAAAGETDFPGIPPVYSNLVTRMGHAGVRMRLMTEAERTHWISARERAGFGLSNGRWKQLLLRYGLKVTGLYGRGYRNFLDLQVTHHDVTLAHLPPAFHGFRILHLSDLHIDLEPALTPRLLATIAGLEYDLLVITGDFRAAVIGSSAETIAGLKPLVRAAKAPIYAVLGNHDFLEIVPPLEAVGMHFLMNETVPLHRHGELVYLSGVDDASTYATDDVPRVAAALPADAVTLLLSHTPDLYLAAAAHGYDLMLAGHTHAGQVCLPGGRILQRNAHAPTEMLGGAWRYGTLRGYTSAGVGATGEPIRFGCPPEVVVHTLRRTTNHT